MLPERGKSIKISQQERDRKIDAMKERVLGYIAGEHFEDDLHKLTCSQMDISPEYDPNRTNENDPAEVAFQEAYYQIYGSFQVKILARVLEAI